MRLQSLHRAPCVRTRLAKSEEESGKRHRDAVGVQYGFLFWQLPYGTGRPLPPRFVFATSLRPAFDYTAV